MNCECTLEGAGMQKGSMPKHGAFEFWMRSTEERYVVCVYLLLRLAVFSLARFLAVFRFLAGPFLAAVPEASNS